MSVASVLEKDIRTHISLVCPRPMAVPSDATTSKVSVVIPSYNQGRFLERTIVSVLNQDWPGIELIIVDGGSTDESVAIIEKYREYLAWWVSERDRGQTDAINKGLARATGKYVTWLGSDDILLPGAVRILAEALDANPQAGMAYGGVAFIDTNDRVTKISAYRDLTLEKLLYHKHSTIAQPSSLLRRSVLEQAGGLDATLHYCMDYDLWIRLHRCAPSVNLGEVVLAGYRLHEESKTVGDYTRMALEKILVNRRYTHDLINKVIYAHYWYIVEGVVRKLRKRIFQ